MNHEIISQIRKINDYYQQEQKSFRSDNDYEVFLFEEDKYYEPFFEYVVPAIQKDLWNTTNYEDFELYRQEILPEFQKNISKKILLKTTNTSEFLNKLSNDIVSDFNKVLVPYKKMEEKLQANFINQFIKNKRNAFNMMIDNNPDLFIETVSKLKHPKLQYYFINKLDAEKLEKIHVYIENLTERELKRLSSNCLFYPRNITPKDYIEKWLGESSLHIKFCRLIFNSKYEYIKNFIKTKNKISQNTLRL